MKSVKIEIHTDGSCIGNPGPGGWAAVIHGLDKEIHISGGNSNTTNNRMEMTAIIEALKYLKTKSGLAENELQKADITLYSDSNLLIQSLNLGWKRKANLDLWEKMDLARAWLNVKWVWVKGHADNHYNNVVDALAQKEAQKFN